MSEEYLEVTERNTIAIISTLRGERDARTGIDERLQAAERQITGLIQTVTDLQATVLQLQAQAASWQ